MAESIPSNHVVLFPYMSKGHIIPLLHFARLLLRHRRGGSGDPSIIVTVFTTPKNQPFISDFLSDTPANVIALPFPENVAGIPPGVESTDKLPSMSLYVPFTQATKLLQPFFEESLQKLPEVSFMVSDAFLWWTSESATKFRIPRLSFFGMNCYSACVSAPVLINKLFSCRVERDSTEPVTIPDFPWIQVNKTDFDQVFTDPEQSGPEMELFLDQMKSASTSLGVIVNSFYELEPTFIEYRRNMGDGSPKQWDVGPLCLAKPWKPDYEYTGNNPDYDRTKNKPAWIRWLDRKLEEGSPVLYVAFGSQAEVSDVQLKEIALGLQDSEVNFLWVTRKDIAEIEKGFEERVKDRGVIVRQWVDQTEILSHESVQGFLSHCGWNSMLETICAEVPVLAWPMTAEQPLNAKFVVEEIKIGIRVETKDKTTKGFVTREELVKKIKELMEGASGKMARKKVKEYAEMAKKAMAEATGSSWKSLDMLLQELCGCKLEHEVMDPQKLS